MLHTRTTGDGADSATGRPPASWTGPAVALAAAPLALLAGNLIGVDGGSDEPQRMAALAAGATTEQIKIVLFLLATTLLVTGVAGIAPRLRGRGAALGRVGAVLAVPGLVAFAGLTTTWLYDVGLARTLPPVDAAEITMAAGATGAAAVVLLVGLLGFPLGVALFTCGLWRAGATSVWSPLLVFAAFAVITLVHGRVGGIAGDLLLFAGLGMLCLDVVRGSRAGGRSGTRRDATVPA